MNREILFRGQIRRYGQFVFLNGDKVPGKWVYGGIFQGSGDFSVIYGGEKEDFTGADLAKFPVYSETVGQFTGLTDKNGKRIFEGDIVKGRFIGYTEECKYTVVYSKSAGAFVCDNGDFTRSVFWHLTDLEVIGNIHDNPEVLHE